jgi:hypothetical protein
MKNTKRSERRYKTYIKFKKVFKKLKYSYHYDVLDKESTKEIQKNARYLRDNTANCSCHMCGNPKGLETGYYSRD